MPSPEDVEKRLEPALLGVVLDTHDLRVVRRRGAHVLVGGIMQQPLGVTDLGLGHSRHPLEGQFDAPEAARPELGELLAGRREVVVGALGDRGVHGRGVGGPGPEPELVEDVHGGPVGGGEAGVPGEGGLGEGAGELGERKEGAEARGRGGGFRERGGDEEQRGRGRR